MANGALQKYRPYIGQGYERARRGPRVRGHGIASRRACISRGPHRLNSGALHALAAGLYCPPRSLRAPPAASHLKGPGAMPRVGVRPPGKEASLAKGAFHTQVD